MHCSHRANSVSARLKFCLSLEIGNSHHWISCWSWLQEAPLAWLSINLNIDWSQWTDSRYPVTVWLLVEMISPVRLRIGWVKRAKFHFTDDEWESRPKYKSKRIKWTTLTDKRNMSKPEDGRSGMPEHSNLFVLRIGEWSIFSFWMLEL